jgi:hypothetical protein
MYGAGDRIFEPILIASEVPFEQFRLSVILSVHLYGPLRSVSATWIPWYLDGDTTARTQNSWEIQHLMST